ncbi:hypothetical protein ACQJBY_003824 [Aegilops geniculata]
MKVGSMAFTVAVVFIGCLVMVGQCRPEPKSTYEDGHSNTTMVVQSKLALKWCVTRDCKTKHEPSLFAPRCFCYFNALGTPCFKSIGDCQNHCPTLPPGK